MIGYDFLRNNSVVDDRLVLFMDGDYGIDEFTNDLLDVIKQLLHHPEITNI